jgi:hypothetical protein
MFVANMAPVIDAETGSLSFCLAPGYIGVSAFNVSLNDDGVIVGPHSSGSQPLSFGPFELTILVNPHNMPPQFRLVNGTTMHVWESSGQHVLEAFATDIFMSPLINALDTESLQNHTFTIAMPAQDEAMFTQRPYLYANGTLAFALTRHAAGVVLLHITITDDGNAPPLLWMVGSLGALDHATSKQGTSRNSSMQTLKLVVSDALMQVHVHAASASSAYVSLVITDIAQALSIRQEYIWFDVQLQRFISAIGRLEDLLVLAARVSWPRHALAGAENTPDSSGQVLLARSNATVTLWSLHRRNFDHIPRFTISESIVLVGFNHPQHQPKTLPRLLIDIQEPPFTLLSLAGQSILRWRVEVVRYNSDLVSSTWVSDRTDGGVLAALPTVKSYCSPACDSNTSSATASSADVTIAQGSDMRNGVVEFLVTLLGQLKNESQVLRVESKLIFQVVKELQILEDADRDGKTLYNPSILKAQRIPCVVQARWAGDLSAHPDAIASIKFEFNRNTSFTGDVSFLNL